MEDSIIISVPTSTPIPLIHEHHDIRVITFNLLSADILTEESYAKYFPTNKRKYMEFGYRLEKTKNLIKSWMKVNFIICFQEMSKRWREKLNIFFEGNNYKLVSEGYSGDRFGVGIAFPTNHYDLLHKNILECGSFIKPIYQSIKNMMEDLEYASDSKNIMISLHLCAKYYGKPVKNLIISTYHMPCRFDNKYYLYSHIHALKVHLNDLSLLWNTKANVFCGDFNIIPNTIEYKLLTSESLSDSEIKECTTLNNMSQAYDYIDYGLFKGMNFRSAYKTLYDSEPLYTNVMVQSDSNFLNCIDYILINNQVEVRSAKVGLTIPQPLEAPSPNGLCPSDHCPLSASLFI